MHSLRLKTSRQVQLLDITEHIASVVAKSGVIDGICLAYAPHATAAIIINEYEPALVADMERFFGRLAPPGYYEHNRVDANAEAHLKSALLGCDGIIPVEDGRLALGTWQRIILCEFDGPRTRTVKVVVR